MSPCECVGVYRYVRSLSWPPGWFCYLLVPWLAAAPPGKLCCLEGAHGSAPRLAGIPTSAQMAVVCRWNAKSDTVIYFGRSALMDSLLANPVRMPDMHVTTKTVVARGSCPSHNAHRGLQRTCTGLQKMASGMRLSCISCMHTRCASFL